MVGAREKLEELCSEVEKSLPPGFSFVRDQEGSAVEPVFEDMPAGGPRFFFKAWVKENDGWGIECAVRLDGDETRDDVLEKSLDAVTLVSLG